ncbi:uncharacterized protein LOC133320958 [Musca vetustissima]|uniref:uncharacterized protein LOC133320958 n=1 Tax=Musca vetustissima TaxID=27455 RepID=UPI002AB7AB48|nr:uncharacterized protein LOC133320958 [Musca vetustissima]
MKVFSSYIFLTLTILNLTWTLQVKFIKLECFEFDKPFATIPKCYLKALSRYQSALNLQVALHQVPVNNVSFNAALYHKGSNGYRPFMYNNTHDIIVKNLILDSKMFRMIPFPANEYSVRIKVVAYNHYKAEIRVYVQIIE